jgi:hypothetical protein
MDTMLRSHGYIPAHEAKGTASGVKSAIKAGSTTSVTHTAAQQVASAHPHMGVYYHPNTGDVLAIKRRSSHTGIDTKH